MPRNRFVPRLHAEPSPVPFDSAEQAWFWFMQSYEARCAGAQLRAGEGELRRPCEPLDVPRVVDRLTASAGWCATTSPCWRITAAG